MTDMTVQVLALQSNPCHFLFRNIKE